MKNVLVLKHYKLKNTSGWDPVNEQHWNDSDHQNRLTRIKQYDDMKKMCISSAKKFLLGLDEIIVHESEVDNIQEAFKQHFFDLHDLWKNKNTNILYADLDVLFIRKFNWFEFSDKFVMYSTGNSGLRYHGHDMHPDLWDMAFDLCSNWDLKKWDYEQDIYIKMVHHPLNWVHQQSKVNDYWNLVVNTPVYDSAENFYHNNLNCYAVHFHATRGESQVNRMIEMFKFLEQS